MTMKLEETQKTITEEEREKFLKEHPDVRNWYNAKHKNWQYLANLIKYCSAVEKEPSELLELKKEFGDVRAEQLLELFQSEYIENYGTEIRGRKFPDARVFNMTTAVKSWYSYNGRTLAKKRAVVPFRRKKKKEPFFKEDLVAFSDAFTGYQRTEFKA